MGRPTEEERNQRKDRALELRLQGKSYKEIGQDLGIPTGSAKDLVLRELGKTGPDAREGAEKIKDLEEQRLDAIMSYLWPKIVKGDVKACEVALKIMSRRASMRGLDAPQKIAGLMAFPDRSNAELVVLARQLGLAVPPELEVEEETGPRLLTHEQVEVDDDGDTA